MLPLVSTSKPNGKRRVLARQIRDFLLDAVLEHAEIVLVQTEDKTVHRVA